MLFDEDDVARRLPKAIAAAEKLRRDQFRRSKSSRSWPTSMHANVESLCEGVDVIVDGTDNFETRFLINDAAVKLGIAWVYGGTVGAEGQSMTILPGETPCLRCLMPECPPPGSMPTCDTAGILGPVVGVIASIEAAEAIKILSGNRQAVSRHLTVVDLWDNRLRQVDVSALREQVDCPACRRGDFAWLRGQAGRPLGGALRPKRGAVEPSGHEHLTWTSLPGGLKAWAGSRATPISCDWKLPLTRSLSSPTAARSSAVRTTRQWRGRHTRSTSAIDSRCETTVRFCSLGAAPARIILSAA